MRDKFQNKYHIQSMRLQNWNYGWNGFYFVTICTKDWKHFFGVITDNGDIATMKLSTIGMRAERFWSEIPQHFSYAKLDAFIVMPNHIHGIIVIDKKNDEDDADGRDAINRVSTNHSFTIVQENKSGGATGNKNPMLYDNLSRIIRWYKGRVAYEARKINPDFRWQSRFYEHIIRNEKSYKNIAQYIVNNPAKWARDKFNQIKN